MNGVKAIMALGWLVLSWAANAGVTVQQSATELSADLGNGVRLGFAVHEGGLLGLRTATIDGVALKSDATLVRPIVIAEHGDKPFSVDAIRLKAVRVNGERITIEGVLVSLGDDKAHARVFVMGTGAAAGKPHRDYYLFPHLLLPAESSRVVTVQAQSAAALAGGKDVGAFRWVIEPAEHNVAGYVWRGWRHHYEYDLTEAAGAGMNTLREVGTWETQGTANGNTLVAFRYRGLGGIFAPLVPMDAKDTAADAAIGNAFTTTEIIPGAVDKAPMVSPIVPGPQGIGSREEGMKYRHGAWIAHLQRGAGANWIDYQYRPTIAMASFYTRMDAIRSMTEAWPGDRQISFTDNLLFPRTRAIRSNAKTFIALHRGGKAMAENESRTRYQEMDLFVRDVVSKDLGFVQHDPVPTLGINWDSGWEFRMKSVIPQVAAWKEAGVRRVITHHPGWFNGRGLRQKETPHKIPQAMITDPKKPGEPAKLQNDTGGDCSIHDYVPQSPAVEALWKQFASAMNQNDIEYWVWITGMVYGTGPVVEKFGVDAFTKNSPDVNFSSGYPGADGRAGHRGISIIDPQQAKWWNERMDAATAELGVSGFWADSFQNMFMSQMNYQRTEQSPQVREWWNWIAGQSRAGVGFMSESHAFPGLSCSIEVGGVAEGYDGSEWAMLYSTRWYRGSRVPGEKTAKADRIFFRTMANKAPIAPGSGDVSQIPSYKAMSAQYMAALPTMRRPFQLPADRGVLWLHNADNKAGVVFAFVEMPVPAGVTANHAATGAAATTLAAMTTYRVAGEDLASAFGMQKPDAIDPRIGVPYVAPVRRHAK